MWHPHEYQSTAERFVYRNTVAKGHPYGAALLLDPGLGKTSICLQVIKTLKTFGLLRRVLVVAPKRVCTEVWPAEKEEWSNFSDLTMGVAVGSAAHRKKVLSLPYDIHVINRDSVRWLANVCKKIKGDRLPWDMVIFDESTSFKTWSADRSKAVRSLVPRIPYRVILTGTPTPKSLADLFGQIWLLDEGAALGETLTAFRDTFCVNEQVEVYASGGTPRRFGKFSLMDGMQGKIQAAVEDMCLRLDARDYLSMPEITYNDIMVTLPPAAREKYDDLERQMFIAVEDASRDISCAAALYTACRQVANGGIYGNNREVMTVHNAKTEAIADLLEELQGKPALIPYMFNHDVDRMSSAIKGLHVIRGNLSAAEFRSLIKGWNEDTLDPPYLMVQPKALSFGINMQHGSGRDIIWYGMTDTLDDYTQLNARIWRQGVSSGVRIHRVLARDTVDEMIRTRTDGKFDVQTSLLESLRLYARSKQGLPAESHHGSPSGGSGHQAAPQIPGALCHSGF